LSLYSPKAYENTTNGWDDKIKNSIQLRVVPLKDWYLFVNIHLSNRF